MELVVILNDLRSVYNTASIFRTGNGAGVKHIYLGGTTPMPVDKFGDERNDFVKVSLGAEKETPYSYEKYILLLIDELKEKGFHVVSLEQNEKSMELFDFKVEKYEKMALVVGNEVGGVDKEVLEKSDVILEIPMRGSKESLNVASALAVAVYYLTN